ncbi:DNA gyrase inhibitor YacG [compost metagenome]
MKCPTCKKETEAAGNPFRPFCSERCKLIDLGRWAAGDFRIPTNERPPEETRESNGHLEEDDD